MMKKILYSILTLVLGLVLSSASCTPQDKPEPTPDSNVTEVGVTINGVTWATRNVAEFGKFAAKPEDAGMYYQWNNKKAWPATGGGTWNTTPADGTTWLADNDPCPDGWRIPTKDELLDLVTNYSINAWDAANTGRLVGVVPNTNFLPVSGQCSTSGLLEHVGSSGYYWACDPFSATDAYFMQVSSVSNGGTGTQAKIFGYSVRCVKGTK